MAWRIIHCALGGRCHRQWIMLVVSKGYFPLCLIWAKPFSTCQWSPPIKRGVPGETQVTSSDRDKMAVFKLLSLHILSWLPHPFSCTTPCCVSAGLALHAPCLHPQLPRSRGSTAHIWRFGEQLWQRKHNGSCQGANGSSEVRFGSRGRPSFEPDELMAKLFDIADVHVGVFSLLCIMHVMYTCFRTFMLRTVTTLFQAWARVIQTKAPYASAGTFLNVTAAMFVPGTAHFYTHAPGNDTTSAIAWAVSA